jgi:uncharacterized membrane protein
VLAITLYLILKSLHVLAAITWVGGAITTQAYAIRTMRSRDPQRMVSFTKDVEFIGQRMYTSASLVLLVLGIWMVIIGPWSFGMAWILSALIVFGGSFLLGAGFIGPESGRIGRLMEAEGPSSPEVQRRIKRIFAISRIELVFLILVVFDMVVKPGA